MVVVSGSWQIEYLDPDTEQLVPLSADLKQIVDDLTTGESSASFTIPNTDFHRDLVDNRALVAIFFDNYLLYSGILSVANLSNSKIEAVLLDAAILMLDEAEPVTGVYDQIPANEILTEVLAATPGTGIAVGDCPATPISVVFYKANRLDIVKFLAEATASEFWPSNGTTINIGSRGGTYWTPDKVFVSRRGIDKSKIADKVIIRGVDQFGRHITGEYGSSGWLGARVRTFNEDTPADQATLQNIAQKKYVELQTDSTGSPISTLITTGYQYVVGDYVNIYRPRLMLYGNTRIVQTTKTKTKVSFQLDKPRQTLEKTIADLRNWEKNGIYLPGCTSWTISLQGLVGLYHLDEGEGTVAKDSSSSDTPNNGVIGNGSWQDGPVCKLLTFAGAGSIDIGNTLTFSSVNKLSVGGWFSPVDLDGTVRYLAHKDGQFALSYVNDVLRFTFTDSSSNVHTFNSDAGKVKAGGRLFVMVTYDGSVLSMYINGVLHKTWTINLTFHASTNKVYLGVLSKGAFAEWMFWNRCLVDQEVTELYFFPLCRVT